MKTRLLFWCPRTFPTLALLTMVSATGCDSGGGGIPTPLVSIPRDEAATVSPDGERVAYFHYEPLDGDPDYPTALYVFDLNTRERTLLVEGNASNPDWSPDGEKIAFDAGDIFTVRPDGSDLRRVTDFGSAFFPAWSPDGHRIAFDVTMNQPRVPADSSGIWLISADGSNRRHIGLSRHPDWSSAGDRLVYQGPPGSTDAENQIWVADTTGENPVQLTANASIVNRYPAWSHVSDLITWVTDTGIWLMDADGRNQLLLVADATWPAWWPDGERIVFSALAPDRSRTVLWTVRVEGSERVQLTF